MVVGNITRHSRNAEASRAIWVEYPRVQDLREGQRAFIARQTKEFKLEEITIVGSEPKSTSFNFRRAEDDSTRPITVIHAGQLEDGSTRVFVEPSLLNSDALLVPVITDFQAEAAVHFDADVLDVARWAGEDLIGNLATLEQDELTVLAA